MHAGAPATLNNCASDNSWHGSSRFRSIICRHLGMTAMLPVLSARFERNWVSGPKYG